ncbi:DUF2141 domain-containing protein [soil metagenome]
MNTTISAALAAFAVMISAPAFAEAPATPTTITLNFDTAAPTGQVMVALYDSEAAYSGGAPVAHAMVDVAAGQHSATFADLPAGDYAAKTFHDVDGDGKMNTNPFGMPTEPYAFSNNARGNMGPARWDAAHFAAAGAVEQTIELR